MPLSLWPVPGHSVLPHKLPPWCSIPALFYVKCMPWTPITPPPRCMTTYFKPSVVFEHVWSLNISRLFDIQHNSRLSGDNKYLRTVRTNTSCPIFSLYQPIVLYLTATISRETSAQMTSERYKVATSTCHAARVSHNDWRAWMCSSRFTRGGTRGEVGAVPPSPKQWFLIPLLIIQYKAYLTYFNSYFIIMLWFFLLWTLTTYVKA